MSSIRQRLDASLLNLPAAVAGINSAELNVSQSSGFAVSAVYTVDTPTAKNFADTAVNVTTDTITITAHGLTTGLKGQVSSTGVLPGGLAAATDYFVIVTGTNTIQLATSLANALVGTAIDLTTQGGAGATHTFTPTALAGCSVKLQASTDGLNWFDIATKSVTITATGSTLFECIDAYYHRVRAVFAITAGRVVIALRLNAK